jgi:hypothetical protein
MSPNGDKHEALDSAQMMAGPQHVARSSGRDRGRLSNGAKTANNSSTNAG